jgi:hypothetical protein
MRTPTGRLQGLGKGEATRGQLELRESHPRAKIDTEYDERI